MIEAILEPLRWFLSAYGAPALFFVMFLQAVVPPIPSDVFIILASVLGMNPILIVLLSTVGSTAGGIVNYYVAKRGGRRILSKMVGEVWTGRLEKWFEHWGPMTVVFTRATPILSSDAITYVAGVAGMKLSMFIPTSFIGAMLRSVILVVLGQTLLNLLPIHL